MPTWLAILRRYRFHGIQARIVLLFSLVLLVAFSATGLAYYLNTIREIKSQTLTLSENTMDQMKINVSSFLDNIDRLSLSIFGDPSVQRILRTQDYKTEADRQRDIAEMNYRLLSYASPWNQVQGIYVFSTDGRLYYSVKGKSPRLAYHLEEEPWYTRFSSGNTKALLYWHSGPETTVYGKSEQVFSLIRPVTDFPIPKRLGYLKIDVKVNGLQQILGQNENGLQSFSNYYIVSQDGHIIYDKNTSSQAGTDSQLVPYIQKGAASGETSFNGSKSLYITRPLKETDWTLLAFVPYEGIVKKMNATRNFTLLVGIIAILIVILLSYFISSGITRPLRVLMRNMQKVEMGNFKVRIPSDMNDEVGHLNSIFNDMVQNLEVLIKESYELKIREKDATLLALQSQINPHFLFNTLNVIKAIGRKRDALEIVGVIESLAEMFRYSMKDWERTVPLSVELSYIQHYIHIQGVRFKSRFHFQHEIPQECLDCQVVKLSLQPIVENAFKHGVERLEHQAQITLIASIVDGCLIVAVENNGSTLSAEKLEVIRTRLAAAPAVLSQSQAQPGEEQSGIGLLNIDRRIKFFFGEEYGIEIKSEAGCTRVEIRHPGRTGRSDT